jgi:hypothetical protein
MACALSGGIPAGRQAPLASCCFLYFWGVVQGNLVMNGIEAMNSMDERPRELIIRTQNDDGGQVRVTVRDSGMGLDPQSIDRIFDAFYTTKRGGMGMGLSISRSIIQNHGGKLWAVANEGPGISVQFTIPKYQ